MLVIFRARIYELWKHLVTTLLRDHSGSSTKPTFSFVLCFHTSDSVWSFVLLGVYDLTLGSLHCGVKCVPCRLHLSWNAWDLADKDITWLEGF